MEVHHLYNFNSSYLCTQSIQFFNKTRWNKLPYIERAATTSYFSLWTPISDWWNKNSTCSKLARKQISILDDNGDTRICEVIGENPDSSVWNRQDNAIKNWIYCSVTTRFLKHLIGKTTTKEYWIVFVRVLNDDSQSRLLDLRWRLQSLRKGTKSIRSYMSPGEWFLKENKCYMSLVAQSLAIPHLWQISQARDVWFLW